MVIIESFCKMNHFQQLFNLAILRFIHNLALYLGTPEIGNRQLDQNAAHDRRDDDTDGWLYSAQRIGYFKAY